MLIAFKSKAGADVLMLWSHAEPVLRALGRDPALQGVFRGAQLNDALTAWQTHAGAAHGPTDADEASDDEPQSTGLRQRAWPVLDLLEKAARLGHDVTWQPL